MKKIYILRFSLFLGLFFVFWGGMVFGQEQEDCRWHEVTDINLKNAWHLYTCEFYTSSDITRLNNYCQRKTNTESNRDSWYECPKIGWSVDLKCHICECKNWTWIDGKCQASADEETNDWEQDVQWETYDTPSVWEWWDQQTEENTPLDCDIKNSQWECCKKVYYDIQLKKEVCCEGILLNTNVPYIGQCIVFRKNASAQPSAGLIIDETSAFPVLMWGLNRLLVSIILLVGFIGILIGWIMISASWAKEDWARSGRKIIGNIITAFALLGASGVILRLINPNFFG